MKPAFLAFILLSTPALAQAVLDPRNTVPQIDAPSMGVEAKQPFKKANIVLIHTTDSTSVAYGKLARYLLADGYKIEKSDKELGYIYTASRPSAYSSAVSTSLQFAIIPTASGVTIEERGTALAPSIGTFPIDCRGAFGSPMARAWAEMCRAASLYQSGTLGYKQAR